MFNNPAFNSQLSFGKQEVILPPLIYNDDNNLDPQMIMQRHPNTGSLDIDSRYGKDPLEDSSQLLIATNTNDATKPPNYLLKDARRIGMRHFELFFYLDNIVAGYNDTFQMVVQSQPPDPPRTTIVTVTLPSGVFSLDQIASNIQDALNAWFVANWVPPPIPMATVTVIPNPIGFPGLLGTLHITVNTFSLAPPLIAVNPSSSFIFNSPNMLVVSASNTWPTPTSTFININFFSLSPYLYIDIVSNLLTQDSKILSATNTGTNYSKFHRIYSPTYGFNVYDFTEPLVWTNVNKNNTSYNIDFRFIDSNGENIRGAVTQNFWWLAQLVYER
jgi:hypothetical protein